MSFVQIGLNVPEDAENYLETSALLRGVSRSMLLLRVLEVVLKDQLILSIFDDDNLPSDKTARKKVGRKGHDMPPQDRFDAVNYVSQSVPMKRRGPKTKYKYTPTRSEMESDLREAVLNTGGELSEKQ